MMDWLTTLQRRIAAHGTVVRVTVATVRGSAPRDAGACMLVGDSWIEGTIGGGHLELMATGTARQMLGAPAPVAGRLDRFPLGAALGQCCGGIVELWFERYGSDDLDFIERALQARATGAPLLMSTTLSPQPEKRHAVIQDAARMTELVATHEHDELAWLVRGAPEMLYERIDLPSQPLWLFGAGHVGRALVKLLEDLPFRVTWIDNREAVFPESLPEHVRVIQSDQPADEVRDAPIDAMFLVLTHDHELDFDICRAILRKREFAWAGLIGSASKARRFEQRLRQRGHTDSEIRRITCPIGVDGIASKLPAAIAVAVTAQVLQISQALRDAAPSHHTENFAVTFMGSKK